MVECLMHVFVISACAKAGVDVEVDAEVGGEAEVGAVTVVEIESETEVDAERPTRTTLERSGN